MNVSNNDDNNAGGTLSKAGTAELTSGKEYSDFHRASSELSLVSVEYLSHNQKLAFWINTFNLMALHAQLCLGLPETPEEWYFFIPSFILLHVVNNNDDGGDFKIGIIFNRVRATIFRGKYTQCCRWIFTHILVIVII